MSKSEDGLVCGEIQRRIIKSRCVTGLVVLGLLYNITIANADNLTSNSVAESNAEYVQKVKVLIKKIESRIGKTLIVSDETEKALVSISASLSDLDYSELLAVLRVNGFAAYMGGRFIYIIPIKEARFSPIPILEGDETFPLDQYVSTIISVEKSCAYKLLPSLRPAVPRHGHLSSGPNGRSFYLTDSYSNVMRIKKLISEFDARETEVQACDAAMLEKLKRKKHKTVVKKKDKS